MLFELWIATGVLILFGAMSAYSRSKDALHPAVVMAAPFAYFYSVWPLLLNREGALAEYFDEQTMETCAVLFLAAIAALYLGLNHRPKLVTAGADLRSLNSIAAFLPRNAQRKIYAAALVIGLLALAAYGSTFQFSIDRFVRAYSSHKGGGSAASGYIGEAINLSLPAILLMAVAVRARGRLNAQDVALALIIALPQLLHGTFGGRRGPIFIILATLMFAWFIATRRTPRLPQVVGGLAAIGLLMLSIQENRQEVYIGSGEGFEVTRALDAIAPSTVEVGNEYVNAVAFVATSRFHGDYYWGYRYFVTFFIRPIPRQLWPTKYEDMNATWMDDFGSNSSNRRILEATGFAVPAGVSTGSIADGFMEFSWGVLLMFYLLGRLYAYVWRRHRIDGGYWTVLLFLMLGLSVYLPSQSFSAWLVRLMYGALGSYLLLRLLGGGAILRRRPLPNAQLAPRA